MSSRKHPSSRSSRSWDPVAEWYFGWSGARGGEVHRKAAIPALLRLLEPAPGERILDLGCGAGIVAPHLARKGAHVVGIDRSPKLISLARKHHGAVGRFHVGDATDPDQPALGAGGAFDGVTFLLSLQDIDPLEGAIRVAAKALRPGGRIVVILLHPCFRPPRQSGWGWEPNRGLQYRRVEGYLSPLAVPRKEYGGARRGATITYHRPLATYLNALGDAGVPVDRVEEIVDPRGVPEGPRANAGRRAYGEIPLLLGIRGRKI